MRIGFIGMGAMGLPMAKNLAKNGVALLVSDAVPGARARAAAAGLAVCSSVEELAGKAECIFLSLPNAAIVGSVLDEIVAAKDRVTGTVVDCSSIAPASARAFAAKLAPAGMEYADCPVSGGVQGAEAGSLTVMVGAADKTFAVIEPYLAHLGKNIHHLGDVGAGSAVKMINNYLLGCHMAATAEALVLAAKAGVDLKTIHDVVKDSSGRSFIIEKKLPGFIMNRSFDGGFQIDLAYKDMGLAADSARELGMPIPMGATAMQAFETARAKGLGGQDITALVKVWEELMGVELR